jgi:hypothetical protein
MGLARVHRHCGTTPCGVRSLRAIQSISLSTSWGPTRLKTGMNHELITQPGRHERATGCRASATAANGSTSSSASHRSSRPSVNWPYSNGSRPLESPASVSTRPASTCSAADVSPRRRPTLRGSHATSTRRRKCHCPGRRLYLDDNCHCRPVDADMIEGIVWRSVTGLLTDPRALGRCRPGDRLTLIGSEPTLDELIDTAHSRVAETEGALAHAAVELVHARLPGHAIAAATEALQRSLDAAVTRRDDLLQRRPDATDVERLNRLRLTLTSVRPTSTT